MEPIKPNPQGQNDVPVEGQQPASGTPQKSKFQEIKEKKNFQTEDDLANAYESAEKTTQRTLGALSKAKKQLESAGYTLNEEDGTIVPLESGTQIPNVHQQQSPISYGQPNYPQQQQQQDVIYDPYTGQPIVDPMARQLASLPLGQREFYVFNAFQEQREKQQSAAYQADTEILSKTEAKGFEEEVRRNMITKPLAYRANKQAWQDELLKVKGARYDQDRKNWEANGVESFLNKETTQPFSGAIGGADNSGVRLNPEQEEQFRFYQKTQPGTFKDRKEFLQATMPNYGR